jgi:hypothetical protein
VTSSETTATLCAALVAAQGALKPIAKDGKNPAFRARYATLDGIMETVRPALAAHGLAVVQGVVYPETGEGGRLVGITVETRLVHTSGEWLASMVPVPVAKGDAHGLGSALSYGRRYGLSALLALSTDEDDDGNAAAKAPPAKPQTKPAPAAPAPGQRLHDRVPTTPPPEAMTLSKAETVSVKAKDGSSRFLVSMNDDELDTLRAWAQDKGNTYMVAAIDAIQASRDAADGSGLHAHEGDIDTLGGSLPF